MPGLVIAGFGVFFGVWLGPVTRGVADFGPLCLGRIRELARASFWGVEKGPLQANQWFFELLKERLFDSDQQRAFDGGHC